MRTGPEIKEFVEKRREIVINDLEGKDEDVNIHGEIAEYKQGFQSALQWVLDEIGD